MSHPISTDYKEDELALARFAKAMGHPARIAILKYLSSSDDCCFGDINKELPIAKATVSQHLSELKDAGLIKGNIDPPKVNYCINQENWSKAKQIFTQFFSKEKTNGIAPKCC
jgi:ArsR family transcriptional regulator, arsenate/arsenite/antimonite-responsive transcriptional repressor